MMVASTALAVLAQTNFVAELPKDVARLTTLLEEGNLQQLREVAHRLKASGGLYGFDSITKLAGNLEAGLKQQQIIDETAKQVNELLQLIRRVEGYSHISESDAMKSA